jgi:hypothetical protein
MERRSPPEKSDRSFGRNSNYAASNSSGSASLQFGNSDRAILLSYLNLDYVLKDVTATFGVNKDQILQLLHLLNLSQIKNEQLILLSKIIAYVKTIKLRGLLEKYWSLEQFKAQTSNMGWRSDITEVDDALENYHNAKKPEQKLPLLKILIRVCKNYIQKKSDKEQTDSARLPGVRAMLSAAETDLQNLANMNIPSTPNVNTSPQPIPSSSIPIPKKPGEHEFFADPFEGQESISDSENESSSENSPQNTRSRLRIPLIPIAQSPTNYALPPILSHPFPPSKATLSVYIPQVQLLLNLIEGFYSAVPDLSYGYDETHDNISIQGLTLLEVLKMALIQAYVDYKEDKESWHTLRQLILQFHSLCIKYNQDRKNVAVATHPEKYDRLMRIFRELPLPTIPPDTESTHKDDSKALK